jgi:capsular polysaccharide biosynthesis protein
MMNNPLQTFLDVLTRRWRLVGALTVLAMVAAALVSLSIKPTYESTAVIALAPATLSVPTSNQSPPYYLTVDALSRLPKAFTPAYYVALLKSIPAVSAQVVSISPDGGDRSLIDITARGENPQVAAQAANALAQAGAVRIQQALLPGDDEVTAAQQQLDASEQALVKFSQDNGLGDYDLARLQTNSSLSSSKKLELARLLRARETAEQVYLEFADDHDRATILASSAYKPTTILASEPTAPISPKPMQNTVVGGALGLLIGVSAALALEYMAGKEDKGRTTASGAISD